MYPLGLLSLFAIGLGLVLVIAVGMYIYGLAHPPRLTYAVALGRGWVIEPSELGLAVEELSLAADGRTLAGWRIQGRDSDGPVIVVLHGYGGSRYSELGLAAILVDYARAVVVFDMPGHGQSTGLSRAGVGQRQVVEQVLDEVVKDDEPVVLLGRSMGAGLALHVAAKMTENTANANDGADHLHPAGRLQAVIVEGVYRHWSEPARRRLWLKRWPPEPMVSAAMAAMILRGISPAAFDTLMPASTLQCPLLILHGQADSTCPPRLGQAVAAAAKHATFVPFPDGGHLNLHIHNQARYRQALQTLLGAKGQAADAGPASPLPKLESDYLSSG